MTLAEQVQGWLNQNVQWEADRPRGHETERERERERWEQSQLASPASRNTRLSTRPSTRSDRHSSGPQSSSYHSTECRHYHYNVHNNTQVLHVHVPPERSFDERSRSTTSASRIRVTSESRNLIIVVPDGHTVETYAAERPRATTIQGAGYQRVSRSSRSSQGTFTSRAPVEPCYSHSYQGYPIRSRGDQLLRAATHFESSEGRSRWMEHQEEEDWSSNESEEADWSLFHRRYMSD
ncbi:hypothetical protein BDV93DRAFT_579491 [Ceratobasidium sp. AG-I]|nr:hypothetical protein BDV93DRAFT_579491 [Ceratobasidium sp. AG-I]